MDQKQTPRPPRLAQRLLKRLLPPVEAEVIGGDLEEEYVARPCRSWYYRQVGASLWACRDRLDLGIGNSLGTALVHDLRFSGRSLRRSPLLSMLAIVALGLAIGANTAVFSVVYSVLWQPLPYHEPERLGLLRISVGGLERAPSLSAPELLDFREQSRSFEEIAAQWTGWNVVRVEGRSERIRVTWVTANLFPMLGLQPLMGRFFTEDEEDPEGPNKVIILSYALWQSRFGGDPEVVGKTVALEDGERVVVGVMPAEPRVMLNPASTNRPGPDAWIPNTFWIDRDTHWLRCVARLTEGVSWDAARAEIEAVAARMTAAHPEYQAADYRFHLDPLHDDLTQAAKPALFTLWAMVGLVLVVACANVAAMLLARSQTRRTEIAVRGALGAGRRRLAMLVLSESVVLAACGGAVGMLLAVACHRLLLALAPLGLPRLEAIQLDGSVLAFCAAVSLGTVLLFGWFPVLQLAGVNLVSQLRSGSRSGLSGQRSAFQRLLLVGEIAIAFVLLVAAGLMARSLQSLSQVDVGFRHAGVTTFDINIPVDRYPEASQRVALVQRLVRTLSAEPGLEAVGGIHRVPMSGGFHTGHVAPEGREDLFGRQEVEYCHSTPGYLRALDIRVVEGQLFRDADVDEGRAVVVVDELLANRFWPGGDAIGRRLKVGLQQEYWAEVVGVVRHARIDGVRQEGLPQLYLPYDGRNPTHSLAVFAPGQPAVGELIRSRLAEVDPDVPISNLKPLSDYVSRDLADVAFALTLMAGLALLALLLSVVGVYGVVSYWVTQGTASYGLRMALGAVPREIASQVLRQGLRPVLVGLGLGALLAFWTGGYLEALLYGVRPGDALTLAAITGLLLVVTVVACLVPAWRATRVEPSVALRSQ